MSDEDEDNQYEDCDDEDNVDEDCTNDNYHDKDYQGEKHDGDDYRRFEDYGMGNLRMVITAIWYAALRTPRMRTTRMRTTRMRTMRLRERTAMRTTRKSRGGRKIEVPSYM